MKHVLNTITLGLAFLVVSLSAKQLINFHSYPLIKKSFMENYTKLSKKKIAVKMAQMGKSLLFGIDTSMDLAKAFVYLKIAEKNGSAEAGFYIHLMSSYDFDPLSPYNFSSTGTPPVIGNAYLNDNLTKSSVCIKEPGLNWVLRIRRYLKRKRLYIMVISRLYLHVRLSDVTTALHKTAARNHIKTNLFLGNFFYDVS